MSDYERIARMIRYLDEKQEEQPSLKELSEYMGLSRYHLQRLFSSWAGITPKKFLQCLTAEKAGELLRAGRSVLGAALQVGSSGPGRLHDLCVKIEGATPGEIKLRGAGWIIRTGFAESPFGLTCIAESPRGLCHLSFVEADERDAKLGELRNEWSGAMHVRDDAFAEEMAGILFSREEGDGPPRSIRAWVRGTEFQIRVWQALVRIPKGSLVSYGALAESINCPGGSRAVGTTVGRNELAYLIPCHRVIRETGVIGNYRWGAERKRAIVAWESRFNVLKCRAGG